MAGTGKAHLRPDADRVLVVEDLTVEFPVAHSRLKVQAVSGISFDVKRGETLGLVGESGCGKSTTGNSIMQLPAPTSGTILFNDEDLTKLRGAGLRRTRPKLQMIFQDPISSLNPRRSVRDVLRDPLDTWKIGTTKERAERVRQVLSDVGLDPDAIMDRRARQFSGGQCQRICIARALVLDPVLIICDEPVSALDVSVQAQVLNLLEDLKAKYGLTLVFIAHDLAVVKNISDRVAVMYLGKMCEIAASDDLYRQPSHHYTAGLLKSIPVADPHVDRHSRERVKGEAPSPVSPPSGCRFRTRCPAAQPRCAATEPELREIAPGHFVACHFPLVGPPALEDPLSGEDALAGSGASAAWSAARSPLWPGSDAVPTAYVFTAYGGPEFQAFIERDQPVAGPGELVIAVHAIGINPVDWKMREGYLRERFPRELPATLGREVAGVVDHVGEGVEGFAVGDEVLGQAPTGACAEYAVMPAATTAHKPPSVSFNDAASLPVATATAYSGVTEVGVRRGETLLVVGAGGGVGSAAVRIARHLGARVIGIASPAKAAFVESLGARHVPSGPGVEERLRALAPDGVDAVFDLVGGDALRAVSSVVGDPARIVTAADQATVGELGGFHVRRTDPDVVLAAVVRLVAAGELASSVTQVFPFEQAGDALAAVESGHVTGKVVVAVRSSRDGRERQSES